MEKKKLYVVPSLEVSNYIMQGLILAASGSGQTLPTEVSGNEADDGESGLAKKMTTVFSHD